MKGIDIYPDEYGRLVLKKNDLNENVNEATIYDANIGEYLKKVKIDTIEEISDIEEEKGFLIKCPNLVIKLHNIDKLNDKNESYLNPLFEQIQKIHEEKNASKLRQREEEGHKPKVIRQNKHSNSKFAVTSVALCVALVLASGIAIHHVIDMFKGDEKFLPEHPKTHDNGVFLGSSYSFETLQEEVAIPPTERIIPFITHDYEDLSLTSKANNTREKYGTLIEKYSNMYGLDTNLMIAIATQESGVHDPVRNATGATGLMQIQNGVWAGEEIKAYNFEKGGYDRFEVTEDMLSDLEKNVQIGCMYFQNCLQYYDYNIPLAIQCYNYGKGNMEKVINCYADISGRTKDEIINDQYGLGWADYRDIVKDGCSVYLDGVLSWMIDENLVVVKKPNNTVVELNIIRNTNEKFY